MFFKSAIFILSVVGAHSMVAYDCSGETINKTTISLMHIKDCNSIFNQPVVEEVRIILTQNSDQDKLNVLRCFVKANHAIKRCGRSFGDDQIVSIYSEIVDLGRDRCERLVKDKVLTYSGRTFEFKSDGHYYQSLTSFGSESKDGNCDGGGSLTVFGVTYDRVVRYTSLEITFTSVNAVIDYEEKVVIFPNGIRCDVTKTTCEHGDYGSLYWEVPVPACETEVGTQAVVYQGPAQLVTDKTSNSSYVQMSHSGYDFQIKISDRFTHICGFRSQFTEHPKLYVTFVNQHSGPFPKLKRVEASNVNMMNYINSKLVYAMRHTKGEVEKLFRLFETERCKSHTKDIEHMLAMADVSPTNFVFNYFHEPGHIAVVKAEAVHVAKCRPVSVIPLQLQPGECFNELKVSYTNKTYFVTPRTRILITNGRRIDCSAEFAPLYYLNGRWVTQTSQGLLQVREPQTMSVDPIEYTFESLESLANGGLYSEDTIMSYQKILTSPLEETIASSRVVTAIKGGASLPDDMDITLAISERGFNQLGQKVMSKMDSFMAPIFVAARWFSVVLMVCCIFNLVLGLISYFINLKYLKDTTGLFKSLLIGLFDVATLNRLNKKKWNNQTQPDLEVGETRNRILMD